MALAVTPDSSPETARVAPCGEPPVRREGWLFATVGLMAAATLALGLLPTPLYDLAARAGLITLVP